MKRAEEFRETWIPKNNNKDYINTFAEDYKNHCINAISDDEIKKMAWEYSKKNITIQYDFIEAVKWFLKNKKLKQ